MAPIAIDMEAVNRFIETIGGTTLQPWQIAALEAVFSGNDLRVMQHSRAHGRAYVDRLAKDAYRAMGYEIVEGAGWWSPRLPA